MKKLLTKIGTKGVFNTIFPKAENSKIGKLVSGIVNGASQATPLTFFQEFAKSFFDTNKDGEITVDDFKGMDLKTFGMAIGFLIVFGLLVKLILGA
jgi:hypothetical protein